MIIWLFFVLLFLAVPYAIAIPVIVSLSPKRPSTLNTAIGGLICGIGLALLGMFAPFWIFDARTNIHGDKLVLSLLLMPPAFGFLGIVIGALAGSRLPRKQSTILFAIAASLMLFSLPAATNSILGPHNGFIVRNASLSDVTNLEIVLLDLEGNVRLRKSESSLHPDREIVLKHRLSDFYFHLEFTSSKHSHNHPDSSMIDLWHGESWIVEIQPDGSLKQGYGASFK